MAQKRSGCASVLVGTLIIAGILLALKVVLGWPLWRVTIVATLLGSVIIGLIYFIGRRNGSRNKAKMDWVGGFFKLAIGILALVVVVALTAWIAKTGKSIFSVAASIETGPAKSYPQEKIRYPVVTYDSSEVYEVPIQHADFRFGCMGDGPCPEYKVVMDDTTVVVKPTDPPKDNGLPPTRHIQIFLMDKEGPARKFYIQSWAIP